MYRTSRYRYRLLAIYTLCYFATRVEPLVVSPLIPDITAALGATQAAVGTAMTLFWAAYALAQIPSGVLADRYGPRRLVILILLCGGAGSVLFALSPSILAFTGVAALLGGTLGLYYNVGVLALDDRFEETGWALGIHRVGSQAAGLVIPLIAAAVGAWYSWRAGLLVGAAVSLPTAVIVALFVDPTPAETAAASVRSQFRRSLTGLESKATVGYVTILAGIGEFVAVANFTFLPTFLAAVHGLDSVLAGGLFSMYFLVVTGTHPLAGWCADRYRPDAVVGAALAAGVVSHGLLVVVRTRLGAVVGVGLAALTMGYNVPLQSKLLGSVPESDRASVFGGFRTAYVLLGSLGGTVTGTIADHAGWGAAYASLAAVLFVGLAVVLIVRRAFAGA